MIHFIALSLRKLIFPPKCYSVPLFNDPQVLEIVPNVRGLPSLHGHLESGARSRIDIEARAK